MQLWVSLGICLTDVHFKQVKYKWGIFFWASTLFLLHPLLKKRSLLISLHLCLSQTDVLQYTYFTWTTSHAQVRTWTLSLSHTFKAGDEIDIKKIDTMQVTKLICGQPFSHVLLSIFRSVQRRSANMCTQCVHAVEMYVSMFMCVCACVCVCVCMCVYTYIHTYVYIYARKHQHMLPRFVAGLNLSFVWI